MVKMPTMQIMQIGKKQKRRHKTKIQSKELKPDTCEMYDCLRKMSRVNRWFGFFPVEGLQYTSISYLKFNLKSLYGIFVVLSLIGQVMMTIITFKGFINTELSIVMFSHFIFYSSTFMSTIYLLALARHFPSFMKEIARIECRLTILRLNTKKSSRISSICLFIMFLGFVEHLLLIVYVFNFVMRCLQDFSFSEPVLEMYFTLKMNDVQIPGYRHLSITGGILFEITNTQATFVWTYVDIIIINASLYLISYFSEFNKLVNAVKDDKNTDWGVLRSYHSTLVALEKKIDSRFCMFVMMSFFTNLFFSCIQLFHTLSTSKVDDGDCDPAGVEEAISGIWHRLYYSLSFIFLIARTLAVCLLAAHVHTCAFEPISALGEIHASKYNIEVQRFYRQLTYTTIGLSGFFFYVTRKMILKVFGTLITYELVLVQFDNCGSGQNENATRIFFNY